MNWSESSGKKRGANQSPSPPTTWQADLRIRRRRSNRTLGTRGNAPGDEKAAAFSSWFASSKSRQISHKVLGSRSSSPRKTGLSAKLLSPFSQGPPCAQLLPPFLRSKVKTQSAWRLNLKRWCTRNTVLKQKSCRTAMWPHVFKNFLY